MEMMLAKSSVSVTELKQSPTAVIEKAGRSIVAVLNHNRPAAYLVPAATYAAMLERLDDLDLIDIIKKRKGEKRIKVTLDEI